MRNQVTAMTVIALLTASLQALAVEPPKVGEAGKPPADKAAAPAAAPMGPPKPAPENDLLKKSAGTWTCEGTVKGADFPETKYKSTWNIKSALGGHWYALTYKRSKMGPMPPFEGHATIGFSVADKKYWFVGVDNLGGWINLTSADGAVYTGEGSPMGKRGPVKFTFAAGKDKKGQESEKLFDATLDLGIAVSQESCKK